MKAEEILVPPDPTRLARLRAEVRKAAVRLGAGRQADALSLVIDELVNNAIEHGGSYRRQGVPLRLRVALSDGRLVLDFFDPEMPEASVLELARGLRAVGDGMPSLDSERGRGLFLVAIHMEELRVAVAEAGGLHLHGRLTAG